MGSSLSFVPHMHQLIRGMNMGARDMWAFPISPRTAGIRHSRPWHSAPVPLCSYGDRQPTSRAAATHTRPPPARLTDPQAGKVLEELGPAAFVRTFAAQEGHQLSSVARNSRAVPSRSVLACQLISAL